MLPDPKDSPSGIPQLALYPPIAGHIRSDLLGPVRTITLRHPAVPTAAVPKAAIDEQGYPLFAESKIRIAGKRDVPLPPGDFVPAQYPREDTLRSFVAAALNSTHDFGALLPRDAVRAALHQTEAMMVPKCLANASATIGGTALPT